MFKNNLSCLYNVNAPKIHVWCAFVKLVKVNETLKLAMDILLKIERHRYFWVQGPQNGYF